MVAQTLARASDTLTSGPKVLGDVHVTHDLAFLCFCTLSVAQGSDRKQDLGMRKIVGKVTP